MGIATSQPPPKVDVGAFLRDVQAGFDDHDLMAGTISHPVNWIKSSAHSFAGVY